MKMREERGRRFRANLAAMRALLLFGSLFVAAACGGAPAQPGSQASPPGPPPAVLSGEGRLDCTISAQRNGHQKLVLREGVGLEFDVEVSPIVDGVVNQKGPEAGGSYRFTSHLAKPGHGTLAGVGEVDLPHRHQSPNSALIADLFKVRGGRIEHIEAVLEFLPYGARTGWDA